MTILTKTQAEHVAQAVATLNNIGGRLAAEISNGKGEILVVRQFANHSLRVTRVVVSVPHDVEDFATSSDFCARHGID